MKRLKIKDAFHSIRNGANIKQDKSSGGIPITRIESISDSEIDLNKLGYAGIVDDSLSDYYLMDGDILMSHINSVSHLGKVAIYENRPETIIHGMNLLCLKANKNILFPRYAFYYFRSPSFINSLKPITKKSVNQASFNISNFEQLDISLPEKLEDQIRIATILSKAEALIKQRKESIDLLDEYLKSTFLEMFGNPVRNEKGWEKKKVEAIANILTGFAFKSENYSSNENDIKICGGLIVYPQFIDWSRANYWPVEKVAGLEKYWLNEGDIIMALDRPWISAGFKLAMIKKEDPKSLLIQRTLRIRCEEINQYYLYFLLFHKVFENHCKPTETTIPHISPKEVQNFNVSIPPIKLQNEFAQIVEKVEAIKAHYRNSLQELENLYGALSQKAFKGELNLEKAEEMLMAAEPEVGYGK